MNEYSGWSARRGLAATLLAALAVLEAGCAATTSNEASVRSPDVLEQIRAVDLRPRLPESVRTVDTTGPLDGPRAQTFYGDVAPAIARGQKDNQSKPGAQNSTNEDAKPISADSSLTTGALGAGTTHDPGLRGSGVQDPGLQGFEMNFENTPVATVAKAILGDILLVSYTIDPRVQGTVSLSSGRPVRKQDLLYVLESALRANNVALVRENQGYRLVPAAEAAGTGTLDRDEQAEAGYGVSVVPLQFVSAQTLTKLLDNFAAKPGMVRADPSRNLLVIQGNGSDRHAAIEAALSFDADWMRGQSVGIYPVSNSTPEPIITELDRIIDSGEGGMSQNVVKLQPISRQNAILVVSRKPELLKTAAMWITRLDKAGTAGTGVKVYRMRYGNARQAAALLSAMFVGGSSSGLDAPMNQLAPGQGAIASSSDQQGFGGQQGGGAMTQSQPTTGVPAGANVRYADASSARSGSANSAPSLAGGAAAGGGAGGGPILANVRIMADVVNNSVLIYANQENYRIIERTLEQLDRPPLQVSIDATVAEVTLNDKLKYGVQFFLKSQNVGLPSDKGSAFNSATATTAAISRIVPGFNFLVGTEADPRVILNALHTVTDVKVLSTPSLVVVGNEVATLQVGDQIPITTRTAQAVDVPTAPIVNSIDYRNTGVILRVAPRINANGIVMLDIEQEISSVAPTSTADSLTPTVSQRRVRSSVAVVSGQTVLLGGLISETQNHGSDGIPVLDRAPGPLGALFSTKSGGFQRTELILFIRPQIIRNGSDARRVAEDLRANMTNLFPLPPPPPPSRRPTKMPITKPSATLVRNTPKVAVNSAN